VIGRVTFFTDPHLGLPRTANTTPASAKALQTALYEAALLACDDVVPTVCLGDVVDRFSNPERVALQALEVVSRCSLVLSGNHDLVNQADQIGTLSLVDQVLQESTQHRESPIVFAPFGQAAARGVESLPWMAAVPHVASQELFEDSLVMALERPPPREPGWPRLLLLHCNYNLSEDRANKTTLNLKPDYAEELLTEYDYILLGHEHVASEHLGGRVIVIGNTHPTGFSDLSDKRSLTLTKGEGFRERALWSLKGGYAEYAHDQIPTRTSAQFVRIVGTAEAEQMLGVKRAIQSMWERSPALYAVRDEVQVPGMLVTPSRSSGGLAQLPDFIRRELEAEPKLLALWDTLSAEVKP
jgi:DNA repair exonuclease SbcCD nuclease subunit